MPPSHTEVTVPPPAPTHLDLRRRNDHVCGSLVSSYSGVAAPSCTGTLSNCAFIDLAAGCCDESGGTCQFHTTCYDHDEAATATPSACTDALCLSCPSSAPFCTEYRLIDANNAGNWLAYSCGQTPTMVFAIAMSTLNEIPLTSTSVTTQVMTVTTEHTADPVTVTASASASASESETSALEPSGTGSVSVTPLPTSAAVAGSTDDPSSASSGSGTNAGLIGGVVGGVLGAVVVALILFCVWRVRKRRAERANACSAPELSQPGQGYSVLGQSGRAPHRGSDDDGGFGDERVSY